MKARKKVVFSFAFRFAVIFALFGAAAPGTRGQSMFDEIYVDGETVKVPDPPAQQKPTPRRGAKKALPQGLWALPGADGLPLDPADFGPQELETDSMFIPDDMALTPVMLMPAVWDRYSLFTSSQAPDLLSVEIPTEGAAAWAERVVMRDRRHRAMLLEYMLANPGDVLYNMDSLPLPPKEFTMTVDPTTAQITVQEFTRDLSKVKQEVGALEVKRIHWLQKFEGSVQFSQAYVSPNWYQGGNSNLNAIGQAVYNVKLNPAFHKDLIFETNFQYKLGINNAPDDSIHAYNISEDLLQVNTTFGLKAVRHWYYSVNGQLKTQILHNYASNSRELRSSFMSPGDVNVGVGMTYAASRKLWSLNASIAPLSYNLKTCLNSRIDPARFGIDPGRKTASQIGSNTEINFNWKIAYNISYSSRLFCFTDYKYVMGDWENTFNFEINRFLTTRLYLHLRYQSNADKMTDTAWHRWQLKEILSFGFAYKFARM